MPLQSEDSLHNEIKTKLEEIGWINGNELLKFKEHSLVEDFYFGKCLEKRLGKLTGYAPQILDTFNVMVISSPKLDTLNVGIFFTLFLCY